MQPTIAKLFATGGSQAVRLPAEFRFDGVNEVYIRRDEQTGDVVLSTRSTGDWQEFMQLRAQLGPWPEDWPTNRGQIEERRDPFEGWTE